MKKLNYIFGYSENVRIFVMLQLIINYASGIFYAQKATILKYRQAVSVYYRPMAIIGCSRLGYLPAFLFNL